jgi:PTS system glucitol/sorbitol-specific IIB component/PTS system glucitol/sorbitol-specific IIC component
MSFWNKLKKTFVGDTPTPVKEAADSAPQPTESGKEEAGYVGDYKAVIIEKGPRGWGGPLTIQPRKGKYIIYSVTGGGIHPIAQRIADLTGGKSFDGFKSKAEFDEIACVVIDCGGTARVGVYPMKGIPTIDIYATTPSGPLAKYINETNFVSGVKLETIRLK